MMAFVIIGADIDLSVASVMGLSACVMAYTFQQGAPLPLAIALALASGVLAGLNNAFWIAYVGLPSLAVTLAGLIGYRGLARILVEDRAIGELPALVQRARPAGADRPAHALDRDIRHSVRVFRGAAACFGVRPAGLCRRQQHRGGALFRRARRPGSRPRCSSAPRSWRRSREYCMPRDWDPCAATWRRDSNSTSSPPCCWEGSAFSGARAIWSASAFRSCVILNLRNGMGLADITGNTQNYVIGGLLILSVLVPNIYQEIQNKWKGRER